MGMARHAQQVVEYQYLAGRAPPRTYPYGGYLQLARYGLGHVRRHALEDDREGTGVLQPEGLVEEGSGADGGPALRAEAPENVDRLGCEAHVTENGDFWGFAPRWSFMCVGRVRFRSFLWGGEGMRIDLRGQWPCILERVTPARIRCIRESQQQHAHYFV